MKVIKQLSEDEFVIKMEDCDLEKESRMTIAHDYVQFGANMGLVLDTKADWRPTGKFAGAFANWIKGYFHVQIGIRSFIKVVLPQLLANEYCKEEHLTSEDGSPNYNWNSTPLIFTDEGKTMVALKSNDGNYTISPHESYMQIKKIVKEGL